MSEKMNEGKWTGYTTGDKALALIRQVKSDMQADNTPNEQVREGKTFLGFVKAGAERQTEQSDKLIQELKGALV